MNRPRVEKSYAGDAWVVRHPAGHIIHHTSTHHAAVHWAHRWASRPMLPPIVGAVMDLLNPGLPTYRGESYTYAA